MADSPPPAAGAHDPVGAKKLNALIGKRGAPDEVLAPAHEEEYITYRKLTDFREPYRIANQYVEGTKKYVGPRRPDTPLIAFINAKSGGRVGPSLASILYRSLGQSQVFDVTEERPDEVLSTLWRNLSEAEARGDAEAAYIRQNLRILVAGGDGTVTWVLGAILALGLDPPPPVAVMPLGTGNDFSFNFGWGTKFETSWVKPGHLYRTLTRYHDADAREMDVWRASLAAPSPDYFVEMPHSLHQDTENPSQASACFWNYFSVGLDAEAAYGFHHLRETHPRLASGRLANQAWYSLFTCTTGWFCGAAPLANGVRLRVRDAVGGDWREIPVPPSVRAVVLLNLQTYGGGRDIWGLAHTSTLAAKGLSEPIYDDGVIEVLGFRSGWHTAAVMGQISPKVHAKRLAQAREVELCLSASGSRVKGERGLVYMQLDGEPWPQEVPAAGAGEGGEALRLRITTAGRSRVLVNGDDAVGNRKSQWVTHRGLSMGPNGLEEEEGLANCVADGGSGAARRARVAGRR